MRSPYGLNIDENCLDCKLREHGYFCDLPGNLLKAFDSLKYSTAFPKGAVLSPAKIEGCSICHNTHGSRNPKLLKRNNVSQLCLEQPGLFRAMVTKLTVCLIKPLNKSDLSSRVEKALINQTRRSMKKNSARWCASLKARQPIFVPTRSMVEYASWP